MKKLVSLSQQDTVAQDGIAEFKSLLLHQLVNTVTQPTTQLKETTVLSNQVTKSSALSEDTPPTTTTRLAYHVPQEITVGLVVNSPAQKDIIANELLKSFFFNNSSI